MFHRQIDICNQGKNMMDTVNHLNQLPTNSPYVFGELLSLSERTYLMEHSKVLQAQPGDVICRQNQLETTVYILLQGEAQVSETVNGKSIGLGKLRCGELFGEISALFSIPRIADVTATKTSVLLEVPSEVFAQFINKTPALREPVYMRLYERSLETALRSVPTFDHVPENSLPVLSRVLRCWQINRLN
jgi:CRP-like cAMP-binding protein